MREDKLSLTLNETLEVNLTVPSQPLQDYDQMEK